MKLRKIFAALILLFYVKAPQATACGAFNIAMCHI